MYTHRSNSNSGPCSLILSFLELLICAFERHLPLTLPICVNQITLFKKMKYSEVETWAFYYATGFIMPEVSFSTDSNQQWNNYLATILDLLAWPHAWGLIFMWGLVSHLVQALAPKEFSKGLLYGPSAQIICHNKALIQTTQQSLSDLMLTPSQPSYSPIFK